MAGNIEIVASTKALIENRANILAKCNKSVYHLGIYVLVSKKQVVKGFHAEALTSQTTSFLNALAA